MKPTTTLTGMVIVLGAITALLITMVVFQYLELRASNRVLDKMVLLKPGQKLSEVKSQLGHQDRVEDKLENVLEWGSVKDARFCEGKKLYWFYAFRPPCRVIEVYTDANDVVVFVTWRGL